MMGLVRRLPVVATILVLFAIGVMIRLGLWQLDRREEKSEMLARYEAAVSDDAVVQWPGNEEEAEALLYRHARLDCESASGMSAIAGQSAKGEAGLAITAQCAAGAGRSVMVVLGWSREPATPDWQGGKVTGVIAPGPRLVADPPLDGLEANGLPDPRGIPNNHLSYAVQWFLFAATALVIYGLAVRKRLAARDAQG